jgi:hypothetical protein
MAAAELLSTEQAEGAGAGGGWPWQPLILSNWPLLFPLYARLLHPRAHAQPHYVLFVWI